ncbi:MAG: rRNA maturation RNase YbeY [Owenweeksia sp.]|nr:rRNA maturation RNase YbeY [Owenweeksia sp.]
MSFDFFEALPDGFRGTQHELSNWLEEVAVKYNSRIINLCYRFVDDAEITEINQKYLGHSYATDVISFGYEEGASISGDIVIGYETVRRNAVLFSTMYQDEICRVMAHGLLHLIGFNDQSEEEQEAMRSAEEKCLILRPEKSEGQIVAIVPRETYGYDRSKL